MLGSETDQVSALRLPSYNFRRSLRVVVLPVLVVFVLGQQVACVSVANASTHIESGVSAPHTESHLNAPPESGSVGHGCSDCPAPAIECPDFANAENCAAIIVGAGPEGVVLLLPKADSTPTVAILPSVDLYESSRRRENAIGYLKAPIVANASVPPYLRYCSFLE